MTPDIKINAVKIIENTMNRIDPRLIHHGKRVAYRMFLTLKDRGIAQEKLRDILLLGVLHDAGAYKTEEIDRMIQFETAGVWGHSI
jgi:HD-GYP domain-containing protein (c-di-GMP phosphodiesterase class II)